MLHRALPACESHLLCSGCRQYGFIGCGLGLMGLSATAVLQAGRCGFSMTRAPRTSLPRALGIVGAVLAGGFLGYAAMYGIPDGTTDGTMAIKALVWAGLNCGAGAVLVPLHRCTGPVLLRAALLTSAVIAGMTCVAVTAPWDRFAFPVSLSVIFCVIAVNSYARVFLLPTSVLGSLAAFIDTYAGVALYSVAYLHSAQTIVRFGVSTSAPRSGLIVSGATTQMCIYSVLFRITSILSVDSQV